MNVLSIAWSPPPVRAVVQTASFSGKAFSVKNARGSKALLKVGAVPEGILRKAFIAGGEHLDQVLYAIVEHDWRACRDRARAAQLTLVH